jgi:hypothetical protein
MSPAEAVQAVFDAARADDVDAAVALFAEDCVIRVPEGTYEGREGVCSPGGPGATRTRGRS